MSIQEDISKYFKAIFFISLAPVKLLVLTIFFCSYHITIDLLSDKIILRTDVIFLNHINL